MAELFNTFLSRLDEAERNLFMGRYWYNYRVEDLATSYGLSENAVHLRIKRTRDKLKAFLEERGYRI